MGDLWGSIAGELMGEDLGGEVDFVAFLKNREADFLGGERWGGGSADKLLRRGGAVGKASVSGE